jgi:hypothetical protein
MVVAVAAGVKIKSAADGLKATARDNLAWLDKLLQGKPFIAGDRVAKRPSAAASLHPMSAATGMNG